MSDKNHTRYNNLYPIHSSRERQVSRNKADFRHATLRRLALMVQNQESNE